MLRDKTRMPSRAAGDKKKPVDLAQLSRGEIQSAEVGGAAVLREATPHAVFEREGLLENFFLHEMRVGANLGVGHRPSDFVHDWRHVELILGRDRESGRREVD